MYAIGYNLCLNTSVTSVHIMNREREKTLTDSNSGDISGRYLSLYMLLCHNPYVHHILRVRI